ncbi:MAG: hypothetical protein JWP81_5191 [Ferruginibacter sp.]|nr:hypothetical protein [Ferruginibacter sp.]
MSFCFCDSVCIFDTKISGQYVLSGTYLAGDCLAMGPAQITTITFTFLLFYSFQVLFSYPLL